MKKDDQSDDDISPLTTTLIALAAILILFNQIQLFQINTALGGTSISFGSSS